MGRLAGHSDRVLTAEENAQLSEMWEYLRLCSLGPDVREDNVLDGTTYVLEVAERGRYHIACRDEPEWDDTFGEFINLLMKIAGLSLR